MQSRSNADAYGIDVSHWQGDIDWAKVRQSGITFAYIKATEGTGYTDPQFTANFKNSEAAGIVRGAYHFARPSESSGTTQADFFVRTLQQQNAKGELPPVLDLEDTGGKSKFALTDWVNQFVAGVKAKTGTNPVIYVSPSFASSSLTSSISSLLLWVADWGVSRPNSFNGWSQWTFWQYSSQGSISGVAGNVDLDVYAGTPGSLHQRFGSVPSGGSSSSSGTKIANLPTLLEGDSGIYVKDLQLLLYKTGQHPNGVTGIFDANTNISVQAFQKDAGISIDGIAGPQTWSHLVEHPVSGRPALQLWSAGQEVTDLQYLLQYRQENPGPIDGLFGPVTEAAVTDFQSKTHQKATGTADMTTWKNLIEVLPQPIA
ncbi:GH25 family lysozyme [Alicyclobacillus sp. SO9]|uniref:GH25 family lysozyme n=1 Tax=Alicyclobacillus sp. SO9 TaxID=2665646 RepID=UPI0018E710CC|nr:GH25 family lysozyme [Alicyclobacillus sp. SO9]QQE80092.1 peptidoglycan-binding protein [Alicyclobacillus sp. SO9]